MDWRIKGVIQGALARVPGGMAMNDVLQRVAGGRRDQGHHIDLKFRADWLVHQEVLRGLAFDVRGRETFEIGTGWLPVFPMCYALAGASRCHTFDLSPHLITSALPQLLGHLERYLGAIATATSQSEADVRARWTRLRAQRDGEGILREAGIVYHAPADATTCGLRDGSVGLVYSNSVLEHITPQILAPMMRECARVLDGGGISLHSVNCGDHYAYFDRSITQVHYLRFSAREWARWNNDLLYQNRLRPVDFVEAARASGLRIDVDLRVPRPELMARFEQLAFAPEFRHYPAPELCCTSVTFAAVRPALKA